MPRINGIHSIWTFLTRICPPAGSEDLMIAESSLPHAACHLPLIGRPVRASGRRSRLALGLLGGLVIALAGCGPSRPPTILISGPPIILISIDTLRADALGVRSPSGLSTTPVLDQLARESVRFTHTFCEIPFTLSSHMSMLTGVRPDIHGVLDESTALGPGIRTLAQTLHDQGYETRGVISNLWLKPEFGFARGFDAYEHCPGRVVGLATAVNARALASIDARQDPERPLFFFVHYYDVHSDPSQEGKNPLPYYSPPEVRERLGITVDGRDFVDDQGHMATDFLLSANDSKRPISQEKLAALRQLYDAGVADLDQQIGVLLTNLKSRGLYDDALIIVTADHGEEFREHGLFIHFQPYDECLAVPLLIRFPGGRHAGQVIRDTAQLIDIAPTILDCLEIPAPPELQGTSLLPRLDDEPPASEFILSKALPAGQRYSLRMPAHKLIVDLKQGTTELYDLSNDPHERTNVAAEQQQLADKMRRRLEQMLEEDSRLAARLGERGRPGNSMLSEEERARLKGVGYLHEK